MVNPIENLFFYKTRMRIKEIVTCINVLKTQVKRLDFRIDLRFEVDRIDKISIRFM